MGGARISESRSFPLSRVIFDYLISTENPQIAQFQVDVKISGDFEKKSLTDFNRFSVEISLSMMIFTFIFSHLTFSGLSKNKAVNDRIE